MRNAILGNDLQLLITQAETQRQVQVDWYELLACVIFYIVTGSCKGPIDQCWRLKDWKQVIYLLVIQSPCLPHFVRH